MPRPSFHEVLEREHLTEGPSDRRFGVTVGGILLALGVVLLWHSRPAGWVWSALGAALLIAAATRPGLLRPANRAWLWLGLRLFAVVHPVVMVIMYCVAIVPMGLLLRFLGKDLLRLKKEPEAPSYWITREPAPRQRDSMRNQF